MINGRKLRRRISLSLSFFLWRVIWTRTFSVLSSFFRDCNSLIEGAPLPSLDNRRSFQVPLSKLDRVRHIVRPSLVTLPRFVQDQAKYKAILRQIGRLNGIHLEAMHPGAGPKQTKQRRAHKKSLLPKNRRTKKRAEPSAGEGATAVLYRKQESVHSSKRKVGRQKTETPPCQKPARAVPVESLLHPLVPGQPPVCAVDHATNATQDSPHHPITREGGVGSDNSTKPTREVRTDEATRLAERSGGAPQDHDGALRSETREAQGLLGVERTSENGAIRRTRRRPSTSGVRPSSAIDFAAFGRRLNARGLAVGAGGWPLAIGEDLGDARPPSVLPQLRIRA